MSRARWTRSDERSRDLPPDRIHIVDLPDGRTRITRRALGGSGGLVLVDAVMSEVADGYCQRWRDVTEIRL
jgi:hypothetical protein